MKKDKNQKEFYQLNRYKMLIVFVNSTFSFDFITVIFVMFEMLQILGVGLDPTAGKFSQQTIWHHFALGLKYCILSPTYVFSLPNAVLVVSFLIPSLFIGLALFLTIVDFRVRNSTIDYTKPNYLIVFSCKAALTLNCIGIIPLFHQILNSSLCMMENYSNYPSCYSSKLTSDMDHQPYCECMFCLCVFHFAGWLGKDDDQHERFWYKCPQQEK